MLPAGTSVRLPSLLLASLLAGCQPDDGGGQSADPSLRAESRPAADALDRDTANRRKQRISDVFYELYVDLSGDSDQFAGALNIRYTLADAASDLTLDFGGGTVQALRVNGETVPVDYNGYFLTLPAASLREGANSVFVGYEHDYSEDGTGLHRFTDPVDGRTYLYTYLWPYYANRLLPSFDQPNVKARISLSVRAPEDWTVVSTGNGTEKPAEDGTRLWTFDATPQMSTYVFSLHAGPYRIWEDDADGVPIRLMARQSLAEYVAVDEWFDVTKRGLEYYGRYFDIPYPFHKYDQLIVPDFNIGAMENIAAVTFSEGYVQRQASDRTQRESRASVILHEMAHMWFGNLVTHDWWNGLWLNESFATQMAAMAMLETTEFDDTWHGFFTDAKRRAYERDGKVTTHPIEMPIASTRDFFSVFDAITYQKGSSVLKQLAHYVGEQGYRRGVSAYLKDFSYGTTGLEDFIGHIEEATDTDLERWTKTWLHEAGYNTLHTAIDCNEAGAREIRITQTAPDAHPVLRAHRVEVASYGFDRDGRPAGTDVMTAEIRGAETTVPLPDGSDCPQLVNPNHNDWTYAKFVLDDGAVETLRRAHRNLEDPLARSMFLAALFDRAMSGDTPLAAYADHAMQLAADEQSLRVQQQISATLITTLDTMQRLRPETDAALARLLPELEMLALQQAGSDAPDDMKRIGFNTFLGVVTTEQGLDTVERLLDGEQRVPGVDLSADLRWRLLATLSAAGRDGVDERLAAEQAQDSSDFAAKSALIAAAARPDAGNKAAWLDELRHPETVTGLARQRAVMAGLFPASQTALQLEYLPQIIDGLAELSKTADPYFLSSYASVLLTPMCRPQSVARLKAAIEEQGPELDSTSLRFLREAHQADDECRALRDVQD